jgi:FkbM family methyltransferase
VHFLRQHAADNDLRDEHLRVFAGAIGTRDGHVEFEAARHPASEWGTRQVGDAPAGVPRVADAERVAVPSCTLHTLASSLRRIDLLHIDIQGSEAEIVAASGATLAGKVARLFVGTHSRAIEAFLMEHLPPLGFVLAAETPCVYSLAGAAPVLILDGGQYWINRTLP